MPVTVSCIECGSEKQVIPARADTFKFCGFDCRSAWRAKHWSGANNPRYQDGPRTKVCEHCGVEFHHKPNSTYATFKKQKFCSKPCADKGGKRYYGPDNWKWTDQPTRRQQRPSKHAAWARAVISRDMATCRVCGVTGVELHAHHIKPYKEFPDLRHDLDNGLTVCAPCHWQIHSRIAANGVNCWEARPDEKGSEGNQQPSFGRKPIEGSTTRGQAYRRWEGPCSQCGRFLSKRWSDATGKVNLFCSKACAGKFRSATAKANAHRFECVECGASADVPSFRRKTAKFCGNPCRLAHLSRTKSHGGNSSTSAPHPPSRVVI